MIRPIKAVSPGQKVYFASDFHLGVPDAERSLLREKKIVRWLDQISYDAQAIFLLGDIFDFWFEYRHAIPRGFIRLQGKLAELTDRGISVTFFTGNHDMWMFDYFTKELNIPVIYDPITVEMGGKRFHLGHGDGLGPGDHSHKLLKKVFANKACQWLFAGIHPNLGIGLANSWSRKSRRSNEKKDDTFLGDDEWLLAYCRETQIQNPHDYYIFGHRHLPLDIAVDSSSRYINLGEWVNYCSYAAYDGQEVNLYYFES
jgi:UDP-2,3-diacylglucosamine hydrolase